MRIISGKFKGSLINTINDSSTRPMMSKAREGIFNILQNDFNNSTVLDLYAGSGSLGIESLSRGADFVTFIELSTKCSTPNLRKLSRPAWRVAFNTPRSGLHFYHKYLT